MKLKNTIEKSRIGYDTIDTKISIFPRTIIFTANNIHSTFGLWHIILFAARRTYARPIVRIHAFTKKHDSPWTKEREREREKERKRERERKQPPTVFVCFLSLSCFSPRKGAGWWGRNRHKTPGTGRVDLLWTHVQKEAYLFQKRCLHLVIGWPIVAKRATIPE